IYTSCHFLFFLTSFVSLPVILLKSRRPPSSTPFPCTTLFRSSPTPDPSTGERPRTPRTAHAAQPPPAPSRTPATTPRPAAASTRSEEHTSELQSRENLVCRLLLEKKNRQNSRHQIPEKYYTT